jgi:hypothetical protein
MMRIIRDDGSKVDVPKVRPIASLLALGTCDICGLSFADGRSILDHGQEDCSEGDRKDNCGKIHVILGAL